MAERGVLRNRNHARQLVTWQGLRWGAITPTDIDAFIDFGDRFFVFAEAKHGDPTMQLGQRLALERLCDACHVPPRRSAVAFLVKHFSSGDIELAATEVVSYRWEGRWRDPLQPGQTFREGVEAFRQRLRLEPAANEADPWLAAYERRDAEIKAAEMSG